MSLVSERPFDAENGDDKEQCKSFDYKICSIQKIVIDDLKKELTSSVDIEGMVAFQSIVSVSFIVQFSMIFITENVQNHLFEDLPKTAEHSKILK